MLRVRRVVFALCVTSCVSAAAPLHRRLTVANRAVRVFSSSDAATAPAVDSVRVEIVHTASAEFGIYAREAARVIKRKYPDVLIDRVAVQAQQGDAKGSFRVLVDEFPVVTKRSDASGVALKWSTIDNVIKAARRRRRVPTPNSGEPEPVDGL